MDAGGVPLSWDPSVARLEIEKTRVVGAAPSDPGYADQWSVQQIGWEDAHDVGDPTGSATLAALDTGVDARHPTWPATRLPGARRSPDPT